MPNTNLLQVARLRHEAEALQQKHGDAALCSIFGAGCTRRPHLMFVFMNPTGRNVSANPQWRGLRAPWLGTKDVWQMFRAAGLLHENLFLKTQTLAPAAWTPAFCRTLYAALAKRNIYVTNLAKCTQRDARPLKNAVFRQYLGIMRKEIAAVEPRAIVAFGNQVSSLMLGKPVSVGTYEKTAHEILHVHGKEFRVFPVYYPVGQGKRNMPAAIRRIRAAVRKTSR